ncbi:DUF5719 family protein [Streptomyces profundus]|uniref:DUF5719 family protein n=1 Tax=Streptomyces profundus TaxID=2867410 RepID=UPI001D163225|nr:DUF5719 family protein [Streptomyces sp. MA3_2.13]UED86006.1 hypothetical protein K4G22_18920 [Streptomyces sp. MA3_2.13]
MNRAPLPLLGIVAALLAVAGVAALRPDAQETVELPEATRLPVERTALTCPRPSGAESATTWYSAFTPPTESARGAQDEEGAAYLLPAPEHTPNPDAGETTDPEEGDESESGEESEDTDETEEADEAEDGAAEEPEVEPVIELAEPGLPVTTRVDETGAPALAGIAEQWLAPGWTVQQTTVVSSGEGTGTLGTACQTPDTEFWFAGASAEEDRHDYVHVTNPDEAATVVDIEIYGAEGRVEAEHGQAITVPGQSSVAIRLSTLLSEPEPGLAVHVAARSGRVGAQVEVVDARLGTDWLPPVTAPVADSVVLPGIPAGVNASRLTVFAPGEEDIALDIGLAGPSGTITPAGHESVSAHAGTVTTVDLGDITQGEASSLVLTRTSGSGGGPVIASLHVVAGEDDERESAFIPAAAPVGERATAAGNTGSGTRLSLFALDETVEVEVTYSAGADGGEPVEETYTVDPGTTMTITPELDDTEGNFALTLTPSSRGGSLWAARTLIVDDDGTTTFTTQTLPDDHSRVSVPESSQDLSMLVE